MANPKKLSYITVDGSGCQTTYYAGQYFNPSGVVLAHGKKNDHWRMYPVFGW